MIKNVNIVYIKKISLNKNKNHKVNITYTKLKNLNKK